MSNSNIVFPDDPCICIVGLGYVGLPLVIEFSKKYKVIGFDSDSKKIKSLEKGKDPSGEVDIKNQDLTNILFSSN